MRELFFIIILSFLFCQNFKTFSQEQADKSTKSDPNVPIFEIKNDVGQTVFAVYPGGVKVFIDEKLKATGGGFTVGRLGTGKATGDDYFTVNPGDVKVILPNTPTKATGGGFTVGRLGTGKASGDPLNYLSVTPDSTRVYLSESGTGGFAVGKMGASLSNFLDLTPDNYFIGHESGKVTTGLYNLFLGYQAGLNNTTGYQNFFAGHTSGKANTSGFLNVFIGPESGLNNTVGQRNIFMGYQAGRSNVGSLAGDPPTIGHDNIYIGTYAGRDIVNGEHNTLIGSYSGYTSNGTKNTFIGAFTGFDASGTSNVFLGVDAGRNNAAGDNNVFLGAIAGNSNSGSNNTLVGFGTGYYNTAGQGNVFLGFRAGQSEMGSNKLYIANSGTSTPLIYGDFNTNLLTFNGGLGINAAPASSYALQISMDGNDNYALVAFGATWCSSGVWAGSDIRFKTNISTFENALDKILKLRGVSFEWKTKEFPKNGFSEGKTVGVIAQEIEQVIPELVSVGPDGYKSVAYDKLTAILIESTKEQQMLIENLQKENSEIKEKLSEMNSLKSDIIELKKMYNALVKKQNENTATLE